MDVRLIQKVVITIPGDEIKAENDTIFVITGDWRLYLSAIEHVRSVISDTIWLLSDHYGCVEFDFEIEADRKYEQAILNQEARETKIEPEHTPINQLWLDQISTDYKRRKKIK